MTKLNAVPSFRWTKELSPARNSIVLLLMKPTITIKLLKFDSIEHEIVTSIERLFILNTEHFIDQAGGRVI